MARLIRDKGDAFRVLVGVYVALFIPYYVVLVHLTPVTMFEEATSFNDLTYYFFFGGAALLTILGFALGILQKEAPGLYWYIAFAVIALISAFVNRDSDLSGNVKTIVFTFSFLCIFSNYGYWVFSTDKGRRHLKILSFVVFGAFTLFCLISLLQLITLQSYAVVIETGEIKRQGFTDGRLFGIFNHPNASAAMAVLAMSFGAYYLISNQVKHRKLMLTAIVVQYLFFATTGSRSARLCLAIAFLVCWLLAGKKSGLLDKGSLPGFFTRRNIAILGIALFVLSFVIDFAVAGYVIVAKPFLDEWGIAKDSYSLLALRPDTDISNISNNRFRIWLSYLGVLSDGSFLFGFGYRDHVSEIASIYPFSYISYAYYEPHNSILLLCVCSGIFAMLVWVVLLIRVFVEFIRSVRGAYSNSICLGSALAFVVLSVILMQAMFANSIWYYAHWDMPFFVASLAFLLAWFKKETQ